MNKKQHSKKSKAYMAVCLALFCTGAYSAEPEEDLENEDFQIEEIVTEGSRLQGSAQSVLQERKEQAFVADILGTDQISRTGDSDAASALRRVTGLTLVDGQFIYIRGLGERYSSTLLNGSSVPSPDPTRNVLPLDLFPARIIESLSVQKSYSPDLPAHFAGGNVNIRTKSIPDEKIMRLGVRLGHNFDNNKSPWYQAKSELQGSDENRAISAELEAALNQGTLNNLSGDEAAQLFSTMNRDISGKEESLDPNMGLNFDYGNRFDIGEESTFGFLASLSYRNEWLASTERNVNNLAISGDTVRINEFADGDSTEHNVKWSGMLNLGYSYNNNHRFELNNVLLRDTSDRLRNRRFENTNTINEDEESRRKLDVLYEERELISHQLKGTHNFPELENLGVDWYYTRSNTERFAPGGFETTFRIDQPSGGQTTSQLARDFNTFYTFQDLNDESDNWGGNISLPLYLDDWSVELKAGVDFIKRERKASNKEIALLNFSIPQGFSSGDDFSRIFSNSNLAQDDFSIRFDDRTNDGDDFLATTLVDSYYFMATTEFDDWRLTAGVRYEDFRQLSIPLEPHNNRFASEIGEIADSVLAEDEFFPSLAVTYIIDSEMQLRFNYSQTTIRPDFRDISTSFYIDPLTEFLVRGSTSLQSSDIDNIDFRWEWYMASGDNLSVALFAKNISKPIEQIELPSATEGAPQLLTANAEDGEVVGVEVEFLKSLAFIGDNWSNYYMSGNFTYSDSEVNICSGGDCLFEQQLREALNTDQDVTSVITSNSRRLIGHSEWVTNLQLGWDSTDNEHSATLVYNVFGPRIIVPGVSGFEDAQEQSFHSLDLVYTWYPDYNSNVKVRVKNLLDEEKVIEQESVDILKETVGTEVTVSYSVDF